MSTDDAALGGLLASQEALFGDPILYKDPETGNFTTEARGIFSVDHEVVDSVTQQSYVANVPSLWIRFPQPVLLGQGTEIKIGESYYRVSEVHYDADGAAARVLLKKMAAPNE